MVRSLLLWFLLAAPALADEVELKNGNVLLGRVTDLGDSIRLERKGGSIVIPKSEIRAIRRGKLPEEIYQERLSTLADDDLEGHLSLARWCREQKLDDEAAGEFRRVLSIDPDQPEARISLGYRKVNGKWMTFGEIQEAKGLVKFRGKWILPAERDLQLALEKQKALEKELNKEVRKWLGRVAFHSEKVRSEAIERLATIDDEFKSKHYVKALNATNREKRSFVIGELGRMKELSAAKGLARRVVWDKYPELRSAALDALLATGHADSALFLAAWLKEDSARPRIRAEEALGQFTDSRPLPALLTLLSRVTKTLRWLDQYRDMISKTLRGTLLLRDGRRIRIPPDLLLSLEGFGPRDRETLLRERDTLVATLRAITGQDFGENVAEWNKWYRGRKK